MKTLILSAFALTLFMSLAVNIAHAQLKKEDIMQSEKRKSKITNTEMGTTSSFSVSNSSGDSVLYVGDDGRVGIGTTTPIRNLHIREDFDGTVGLDIENLSTGALSAERLSFNNEDGTVAGIQVRQLQNVMSIFNNRPGGSIGLITGGITVPRLTVTSTGNVGIGTTSPQNRLHIHENSSSFADLQITNNTTGGATGSDGFRVVLDASENGAIAIEGNKSLRFITNNSERMTVQGNGNVGIGTTSPVRQLHIHNPGGGSSLQLTTLTSGTSGDDGLWIQMNTVSDAFITNQENGRLHFGSSLTSRRMTIDAVGNVGMGTPNPGAALHINHAGANQLRLTGFGSSSIQTDNELRLHTLTNGAQTLKTGALVVSNSYANNPPVNGAWIKGDVGIGTTSPNFKLDVRGTIGNNTTLYHSDIRWKKNVQSLPNSLDKVTRLRGVNFEWRGDKFADMNFPAGKHVGLIAQEVEEVIPEVVNTAADGYKSVAYANLVAVLIEAVKEQQRIIDEQNSKIAAIEARMANDEYTLNNLNE